MGLGAGDPCRSWWWRFSLRVVELQIQGGALFSSLWVVELETRGGPVVGVSGSGFGVGDSGGATVSVSS